MSSVEMEHKEMEQTHHFMTSHSVMPSPMSASLKLLIDLRVAHALAAAWKRATEREGKVGLRMNNMIVSI